LSITIFNGGSQCATVRGYHRPQVPERPVFHPELAAFFEELRVSRGLGFRQIVKLAQERAKDRDHPEWRVLKALTFQTLRGLEKGTTKTPDQDVLRAAAVFYGLSYEDLAGRYVHKLFGLAIADTPQEDGGPVAAPASTSVGPGGVHVSSATGPLAQQTLRDVITAAAAIIELGERIQAGAGEILGGQDAIAGARPAAVPAHSRTRDRSVPPRQRPRHKRRD
jgi:hypothetical protein